MPRNTSLTRAQLTTKANQWLKDNPKRWKSIRETSKFPYTELQNIIEKEHGKAHWRDRPGRNKITGSMPTKSDPGVPFTLEDAGNGKVKFKSTPTRAATRGNPTKGSSGTRQYLERAATPSGVDFSDSQRAMAEARAAGPDMDGGHKIPLDRTVRGQEHKVQSGRGTVQEYRDNFKKSGQALGHQRANIEPQTRVDNRIRQRSDYAALDRHLKQLDEIFAQGKAFKMGKNALRGHIIGYLPDVLEIADNYTNGAVSNGINTIGKKVGNEAEYVAKNFANRVEDGWNGLVDAVNGSKGDYGHDYGQ